MPINAYNVSPFPVHSRSAGEAFSCPLLTVIHFERTFIGSPNNGQHLFTFHVKAILHLLSLVTYYIPTSGLTVASALSISNLQLSQYLTIRRGKQLSIDPSTVCHLVCQHPTQRGSKVFQCSLDHLKESWGRHLQEIIMFRDLHSISNITSKFSHLSYFLTNSKFWTSFP